jgi:CheY-like chemotaxis protein
MALQQNNFLIVENDPNDAFLIKRALAANERGISAFVCRNPGEAQAYLRGAGMYQDRAQFPLPDVILTDLRMGLQSGVQLVEWLRRQESPLRDTLIVILTGSAGPAEYEAAEKVGAQAVYRKPTKLEDLRTLLAKIADSFCAPLDK